MNLLSEIRRDISYGYEIPKEKVLELIRYSDGLVKKAMMKDTKKEQKMAVIMTMVMTMVMMKALAMLHTNIKIKSKV